VSTRPTEEFMYGPRDSFYNSFPELKQFQDSIYLLYASTHIDHTFIKRGTKNIIDEIYEARSKGKKKIVFFNNSETFIEHLISNCQRIAEMLTDIPKEDLFFGVGSVKGQEFYDQLCKQRGWTPRFTVLSSHHFEYYIKNFSTQLKDRIGEIEYNVRPKDKLFVCFNKLHRKHRLQLLAEAIRNSWLDKSYYSFEGATPDWLTRQPLPITSEDLNTILSIKDRYPLRLNITNERHNPVDLRPDDVEYHDNSYFSIVTETIMSPYDRRDCLLDYMNTLFLSEKIYKPFAFKHPFIAFAWPGTLAALRERGYKTFHPYIDESYDDEQDYEKRFKMLIKEIKRLEQFTTEQWIEWQRNIKPIVEHNYKYLLQLDNHRDGDPVDHFFKIDTL
jgi:hypothetical protein